jgi:excisionase family DNA binding protein
MGNPSPKVSDIGDEERLLVTLDRTCKMLDISRSSLDRILRNGELPYVMFGADKRIRPSDLRAYVGSLPEHCGPRTKKPGVAP